MVAHKETSSQNKQVLKKLLALPGNGFCAECKTSAHPRWASWNLGIFLCIDCSGVHRGLGTHISKVRSVDLDTWTDMHLEKMISWGNNRSNAYWEAKLAPGYKPDKSRIVNFIRTKYELKRWVMSADIPDPKTLVLGGEDVPLSTVKQQVQVQAHQTQPTQPTRTSAPAPKPAGSFDLLDFGTPTASSGSAPGIKPTAAAPVPVAAPVKPTVSTPASAAPAAPAASASPLNGLYSQTKVYGNSSNASSRAELKQSILSLYAQKPAQPAQPQPQPQPVQPEPNQNQNLNDDFGSWSTATFTPSPPSSQNNLTNSLSGLNLGPTSTSAPAAPAAAPASATSTYTSLFSASPAAPAAPAAPAVTPTATATAPVEESDDVFANVWR